MSDQTPTRTATAAACPYLGLPDDPRTRFAFPTPAHRCQAAVRPALITLGHQVSFCLTDDHPACPRYRPLEVEPSAPPPAPIEGRSPSPTLLSVVQATRPAPIERRDGAPAHRNPPAAEAVPDPVRSPVGDILLPVGDGRDRASPDWIPPAPTSPDRSIPRTNRPIRRLAVLVILLVVGVAALAWALLAGAVAAGPWLGT